MVYHIILALILYICISMFLFLFFLFIIFSCQMVTFTMVFTANSLVILSCLFLLQWLCGIEALKVHALRFWMQTIGKHWVSSLRRFIYWWITNIQLHYSFNFRILTFWNLIRLCIPNINYLFAYQLSIYNQLLSLFGWLCLVCW